MTKTYSSKSNAMRAANKHDAASVGQNTDGAWVVIVAGAADGIDETPEEDLPTIQVGGKVETADDRAAFDVASEQAQAAYDAKICATGDLPEADGGPAALLPLPVTLPFIVSVQATGMEATAIALFIATRFARPVEIYNSDTESLVQTVPPGVAKPGRGGATAKRGRSAAVRDATIKPVITAVSNVRMQALMDKIDAVRGDAKALKAMNTFSRSGTYYKQAGRFLDALLAEVQGTSRGAA